MKKFLCVFVVLIFSIPQHSFAVDSLRVLYRNFYQLQAKQKDLQEQIKHLSRLTDSVRLNDEKQFAFIQQQLGVQSKQTEELKDSISQNSANNKTFQLLSVLTLIGLLLLVILLILLFLNLRKKSKELKNDLKNAMGDIQRKLDMTMANVYDDVSKIQQNMTSELSRLKALLEELKTQFSSDVQQISEKHAQDIEKLKNDMTFLQNEWKEQWNALKNEIASLRDNVKNDLQQHESTWKKWQGEAKEGLQKVETFFQQTKTNLENELKTLKSEIEKLFGKEKP